VSLADDLRAAPLPAAASRALGGEEGVWIAGGAVRDAALGREVTDLDLAVAGDPGTVAKALGRELGEHAFELSAEFGTWRVVAPGRGWQVDVTRLRGDSIEADLAARDFTVGAAAVPLPSGDAIDPFEGLVDLERGILRAVGPATFTEDPLRLLRAARLAVELNLRIDPDTIALAHDSADRAAEPAGERQLAELRRLLASPDPLRGLELLDELRLTAVVLPELEGTKGVEQGPNHHRDVHGHTLEVLERTLEIEADLPRFVGEERGDEAIALLAEPLADEMDRAVALRFGALFHDIAKPMTRAERDGFVGFKGHDVEGVTTIGEIMGRRLRASRKLTRHLQALTLHHLRLGFLIAEAPLPPRRVHEYLRATEPVTVDVTLLTVADRLSARGHGPIARPEMVEAHLTLAREMIAAALDWRRDGPPVPLLRGDEIAAELGIEGPEIGAKLAELEAAQYAGEVTDRAEALGLLRG
jgi:putative nucleotidyltransferase with HDIG domain